MFIFWGNRHPYVIEIPLITEVGLAEARREIEERKRYEKEREEYLKLKKLKKRKIKREEKIKKIDRIVKKHNILIEDFYIYNRIMRASDFFGNDLEKLIKSNIKFKIISKIDKERNGYNIYIFDLSIYKEYRNNNKINNSSVHKIELDLEKKYKEYIGRILGINYMEIKSLKKQKKLIEEEQLKVYHALVKKK